MATTVQVIYSVASGTTGRKKIILQFLEADGVTPTDISGATAIKLQGTSTDLPSKTIDAAMTILDGPQGKAQITNANGLVNHTDLGSLAQALYSLQGRLDDGGGLRDYGPAFDLIWRKPLVP